MRAARPLLELSRHERAATSMFRAAVRTRSRSEVSTPPSVIVAAIASRSKGPMSEPLCKDTFLAASTRTSSPSAVLDLGFAQRLVERIGPEIPDHRETL